MELLFNNISPVLDTTNSITTPAVTSAPIWVFVVLFVLYIVIHVVLLLIYDKKNKEFLKRNDLGTVEYAVAAEEVIQTKRMCTWFPAVYVVFVMVALVLF